MLEVGNMVKVIGATISGGVKKECILVGTICKIVKRNENKNIFGIVPISELPYLGFGEYWYSENDLEKGHLEWVKE